MSSPSRSFVINWTERYGRHLVASQDIFPGEVIIDEDAIVQGPSPSLLIGNPDTSSSSICLVCCSTNYGSTECPRCTLPICSEVCSQCDLHVPECQLFCNFPRLCDILNQKRNLYQFINVLRCLFTKIRDPIKWRQILELQSNALELPKPNALAEAFELLTWKAIVTESSTPEIVDIVNDQDNIQKLAFHCLGAFRTNAFSELRKQKNVENLYFFSSFMAHSCYMNTDRQFDPNTSRVIVRAARKILAGEPITNTYVHFLSSSAERYRHLASPSWNVCCSCLRCEDPTEFGTFFSALQCPSCSKLTLVPRKDGVHWHCLKCQQVFSNDSSLQAIEKLRHAEQGLGELPEKDLRRWLEGVHKEGWLSPNHAIIIQAKFQFCQLQAVHPHQSPEDPAMKLSCAEDVLLILEKLFPGTFMFKGRIRFHRWLAFRELQYQSQRIDYAKLKELGKEAFEVLQLGVLGSVEFQMSRVLMEDYPDLANL